MSLENLRQDFGVLGAPTDEETNEAYKQDVANACKNIDAVDREALIRALKKIKDEEDAERVQRWYAAQREVSVRHSPPYTRTDTCGDLKLRAGSEIVPEDNLGEEIEKRLNPLLMASHEVLAEQNRQLLEETRALREEKQALLEHNKALIEQNMKLLDLVAEKKS